jgi:hypothetical protein
VFWTPSVCHYTYLPVMRRIVAMPSNSPAIESCCCATSRARRESGRSQHRLARLLCLIRLRRGFNVAGVRDHSDVVVATARVTLRSPLPMHAVAAGGRRDRYPRPPSLLPAAIPNCATNQRTPK